MPQPPFFFRYFWFIAAGIMLVNVFIWKRRLTPLAERGVVSHDEVSSFLRGATIWLVGGSLVAGLIALGAGWPSPFCAGMLSFADLPSTLMSVLAIIGWAALLWWVWKGNGANFLSRALPELDRRPRRVVPTPRVIRLFVTAMVVFSGVAGPIFWRTMPNDPTLGCPARAATAPATTR